MSIDGMGESWASNAVTVGRPTVEKCPKADEERNQLLPGIPNEITLDHICTKLPWKASYVMSAVSPKWRQAIKSRRVYDARVRSESTETLIVHGHIFEIDFSCESIYLYSTREKRCYKLPEFIPGCNRGIPWECRCISLDGKIYVLGGGTGYGESCADRDDGKYKEVFKEVYVLDLVEPGPKPEWRKWKQCASMQEGRLKFGCGVIGGKIYVFGGSSHYGPVLGSEVYDPKGNSWYPITPMKSLRFGHQVATLGEVILVYGGKVFGPNYAGDPFLDEDGFAIHNNSVHDAMFLEAYHPVKDEWRVVEPFRKHDSENIFLAGGKFNLITELGVYVQDTDTNSWKELHSNSFPYAFKKIVPGATVIVNDALYMGVDARGYTGDCLLEGKGFGSDNLEIVWHEANCNSEEDEDDGCYRDDFGGLHCSIQL